MDFTPEHLSAIRANNHTLLVSAAAGSGKTAVLIERIFRLISEGCRLNRMLVVTFTRAAAAEMRSRLNQRIRRAMRDNPAVFSRALDDLERARISTLHSFCQDVVRGEFQAVGVDPTAKVAEEKESARMRREAIRDALNALLAEGDGDFAAYVRAFGVSRAQEDAEQLYLNLMSLPDPFGWLDSHIAAAAPERLPDHPWLRAVEEEVRFQLLPLTGACARYARMLEDPIAPEKQAAAGRADLAMLRPLLDALEAGDAPGVVAALETVSFARAPGGKAKDEAEAAWREAWKAQRDALKKQLTAAEALAARCRVPLAQQAADLEQIHRNLVCLARLTREAHTRFLSLKCEQRRIDFSDMEQMTCALLTDPDRPAYREKYREAFDHIFVDECQDISQIQYDIIMALHGEENRLFMVGDVKQSIYRFRMANPTLFMRNVLAFSREEDARERVIFLQSNFRSLPPVLEATNRVFERVLRRDLTELDYTPEDALRAGRTDAADAPKAEILIALADGKRRDQRACELALVADRIRSLVRTPRADGAGCYRYRDIVILLRVMSGQGKDIAEALRGQGIPVYCDGRENYYELPEILAFRALLTLADNPMDDLSLLAVLRQVFHVTDTELAQCRLAKSGRGVPYAQAFDAACEADGALAERLRAVRETLSEWRFRRETMPLFDYCWYLLRESGLYVAYGAGPDGEQRQANLRLFCQKASDFADRGGTSLRAFLEDVDNEVKSGDSSAAQTLGEEENLVRIMTIHKSKGLQFPVCICMDLGREMDGRAADAFFHRDLGVCLPYINRELSIRRRGLGELAISARTRAEERAEAARLLYVAMTRAQERLILTGAAGEENPLWDEPDGDSSRIVRAGSMLDWVMMAARDLERSGEASPFTVRMLETDPLPEADPEAEADPAAPLRGPVSPSRELLSWWDAPPRPANPAPLKTSVTSLVQKNTLKNPLPLTDEEEEMADKRQEEIIRNPLRLSELPARPAWLEERKLTAAGRGTCVHRFLSLVPLDSLRGLDAAATDAALRRLLREMREHGIFTEEEARAIWIPDAAAFFRSALGQRFLSADRQEREWNFNYRIPGEEMLLQGVIDAAFREPDGWVILDYKTDRIEDKSAFVTRYREQLDLYARALEAISGEKVKEKWLYSLQLSEAMSVED